VGKRCGKEASKRFRRGERAAKEPGGERDQQSNRLDKNFAWIKWGPRNNREGRKRSVQMPRNVARWRYGVEP